MNSEKSGLGAFDAAVVEHFTEALRAYAMRLTANFASLTAAQPEDQLKAPVMALLEAAGIAAGTTVVCRTETRVDGVAGRPDIGADADGLPVGNVELKAPGNGALPHLFADDRSKQQFERFKKLPNLIYTDGRDWALFRDGVQVGEVVKLSADPTSGGGSGVTDADGRALLDLLGLFLQWSPIVPSNAAALAALLAPLTRLLRDEVLADVRAGGVMADLATEWREILFPDADDATFADGYAQTFTYALLLARLEGAQAPLSAEGAAKELDADHALLAQALRILGQPETREAIGMPVGLLERIVGAVDPAKLASGKDPWLYFYEDFLAAYDPAQRNNRGVYYTPFEVVAAQVRMCHDLLVDRFDKLDGFGEDDVVVLDPATGTGTYPLTIVRHAVDSAVERIGEGIREEVASRLARNLNAFEILVGPYAVAHLRLSRTLVDEGALLPAEGVNVFLTDALAAPAHEGFAKSAKLYQRKLAREQERASRVKDPASHVTVVIGNPPYDRDTSGADSQGRKKGGMVRHGDDAAGVGLLRDFLDPLPTKVRAEHGLNLYNDYVYFWRWAIWKTCQQSTDHGITCFITASSFITGPAYGGMREMMRREFDELWVIDLGGEGRGARKDDNVFDGVLSPVAITVAVRLAKGTGTRTGPATVRYRRVVGSRSEKLASLAMVDVLTEEGWLCPSEGWQEPFLPASGDGFGSWPAISDIFGWSARGIQFSRTWPVAESEELARRRWAALVGAPESDRGALLRESRDSQITRGYPSFLSDTRLESIESCSADDQPDAILRVGFRSFDRQWCVADRRVIDMPRPPLWGSRGPKQVFFTTYPSGGELTRGPALIVNIDVPDLNAFNNRGGLVLPLFKDAAGEHPNIPESVCKSISQHLGLEVSTDDLASYVFGLLGTGAYTRQFHDQLADAGVRIPLTRDGALFQEVVDFGRDLLWWASFGERNQPADSKGGSVKRLPPGVARNTKAVPGTTVGYPTTFSYDSSTKTIAVGDGEFGPVDQAVWDYEVSGLKVVQSWLGYRMQARSGKSSSPLDRLRPDKWTFSAELVELLAVVEHLVAAEEQALALLKRVCDGEVLGASDVDPPTEEDRQALKMDRGSNSKLSLFDSGQS